MNQSPPLYDMASALETLEPWLDQHLPAGFMPGADPGPQRTASLNVRLDLPHRVALDLTERFVAERPEANLDAYYNLDARLGWRPRETLELSLRIENVFDRHYFEQPSIPGPSPAFPRERTAFARMNWQWRSQ